MAGKAWHFIGVPEVFTQDDGRSMIAQLNLDGLYPDGLFVRFVSWRDDGIDHEVEKVRGKLVKFTVEILDD